MTDDGRDSRIPNFPMLRASALALSVAGATGAVALVIFAGQRNPSRLLIALFVVWVLGPFVAQLLALRITRHASPVTQATLYVVMIATAIISIALYAKAAFSPPRQQAAFMFVIVAPVSVLALAAIVSLVAFLTRRPSSANT